MSTIHIVSILDRSGSMADCVTEVIGAYNSFIEGQKEILKDKSAKISLILFDDQYEEVYLKQDIEAVPQLCSSVYYTRGMTALYDAIGKTISKFDKKKKVIFFIETDGCENSSNEYSADSIKQLIEKKKAAGWDFNFVGADLSKTVTKGIARTIGISEDKTLAFSKSSEGYSHRNAQFFVSTLAYVKS